jgi:hypothetical protein
MSLQSLDENSVKTHGIARLKSGAECRRRPKSPAVNRMEESAYSIGWFEVFCFMPSSKTTQAMQRECGARQRPG